MEEILPNEIIKHIFDQLSSKDRSRICSVSSKFNKISLESSNFNEFIEYDINTIYKQRNYHILVRLKNKELLDLFEACVVNDYDLVKLYLRILNKIEFFIWFDTFNYVCSCGYFDIVKLLTKLVQKKFHDTTHAFYRGFLNACKNGHLSIVEFLLNHNTKYHSNGFIIAHIYGRLNIVEFLEQRGEIRWTYIMDHSCKTGRINIVKYIVVNKKIFSVAAFIPLCK